MTKHKSERAKAVTRLFMRTVRKEIIATSGKHRRPSKNPRASKYKRQESYLYPKPLPQDASVWNACKIRAFVLYQGFSLRLRPKMPIPQNAVAIEMEVLKAMRAAPDVCYHRKTFPYFADLIRTYLCGKPGCHVLITDTFQNVIPAQQLRAVPVYKNSEHYEVIFPGLQHYRHVSRKHTTIPYVVFGVNYSVASAIRGELQSGLLRQMSSHVHGVFSPQYQCGTQDILTTYLHQADTMHNCARSALACVGIDKNHVRYCTYRLERAHLEPQTSHLLEDMVWYHGTSEEHWLAIQSEGMLFGKRGSGVSRCTYLAADREEAECHGDIVLEVHYNPFDASGRKKTTNNYCYDCWQMRVYEPIPLTKVSLVQGLTC